jgi:hypothetical protein
MTIVAKRPVKKKVQVDLQEPQHKDFAYDASIRFFSFFVRRGCHNGTRPDVSEAKVVPVPVRNRTRFSDSDRRRTSILQPYKADRKVTVFKKGRCRPTRYKDEDKS